MAEYKKETDKVHKVTLKSKITHAIWGRKSASVGEKVNLEVRTQFVGNGSEIQIKVQDKSGKTIEKITDKIYADIFRGSITIPDKTKEDMTFTAKLPKHGLEMKSEVLKVIPPRIITNAKWSQQEARRGDIVKLTAETKGIPDDTEVIISIYEHDQDEAHDFITKLPARIKGNKFGIEWEYEYHEDVDEIPTDEEMKKVGRSYNHPEYFFIARCGGAEAKSELLKFKDWISFELINAMGGEEVVLHLPDGNSKTVKLDENGRLKEERVPPGKCWIEIDKKKWECSSGMNHKYVLYYPAIIIYPSLLTPQIVVANDMIELIILGHKDYPLKVNIINWQLKISRDFLETKPYKLKPLFDVKDGEDLKTQIDHIEDLKIDDNGDIQAEGAKIKGIIDKRVYEIFKEKGFDTPYGFKIKNTHMTEEGIYNLLWVYNGRIHSSYKPYVESIKENYDDSINTLNYELNKNMVVEACEIQDMLIWQDILAKMNGKRIKEKGQYCFQVLDDDIDYTKIDLRNPIQSYHPVFYYKKDKKYFNLAHITDLHICSRQQVLNKSIARVIEVYGKDENGVNIEFDENVSPPIGTRVNISSKNVKVILDKIGNNAQLDMLLITGDIIDYIKSLDISNCKHFDEGLRDKYIVIKDIWDAVSLDSTYQERYQDFVDLIAFYSLIIYFYKKFKKPAFIVSGNHDCYYKPFGISPRLLGKRNEGIPVDHNLTIYEAILAFGKTYDKVDPEKTPPDDPFKSDMFKWFYSVFTPFSDFAIQLPNQILVGLGWGDVEDKMDPTDPREITLHDGAIIKGHLGRAADAISDDQMKILEHALNSKKKVILMTHFTFVSYYDHVPSDKKEKGLVMTNRFGLTDAGEFTVYDNGTFGEHREDLYVNYICPRTDPKLNKKIQLILSGHSHRRGLYTTPGLNWRSGGWAVETKFYDFEQLEKAKDDIRNDEIVGTLIIVSDSVGPLPRYNKWENFLEGWESDKASGTKVIFYENGAVKSIEPIPVGPKPRLVVTVDYFDLLTDERIITKFTTPIMPNIEDKNYEKPYSFQVGLNERLSKRNIYVVDIIMYHKIKDKEGWCKVQLVPEESLWVIKGKDNILIFRDYISNNKYQEQNFIAIKLDTGDKSLKGQYDFEDYWTFPFYVEEERGSGFKRYKIIREKDKAEKPNFDWYGNNIRKGYIL